MITLGLDVSTTNTGVVILDPDCNVGAAMHGIAYMSHIDFKGCETFWEKCDRLEESFTQLKRTHSKIDAFVIEEPMKRFAEGFSSAEVISMLQRFNGIACYLVRDTWGIDPTYINVSSARKLAGVRVTTKAKSGGKGAKEQAFEHMMVNDLSHITWPKKQRSENIVDWARDIVDAYVIAKAGVALSALNT